MTRAERVGLIKALRSSEALRSWCTALREAGDTLPITLHRPDGARLYVRFALPREDGTVVAELEHEGQITVVATDQGLVTRTRRQVQVTVALPPPLRARADATGIPFHQLVVVALTEYLDRGDPKPSPAKQEARPTRRRRTPPKA